jgi:uncharacterized radical SAM superfamily protein
VFILLIFGFKEGCPAHVATAYAKSRYMGTIVIGCERQRGKMKIFVSDEIIDVSAAK